MLPLKNGHVRAIRFNGRDAREVEDFLASRKIRVGLPVFETHSCASPNDAIVRRAINNGFHPDRLSPSDRDVWDTLPLLEDHAPLIKI